MSKTQNSQRLPLTDQEISGQLEHMLCHPNFKASPTQIAFLKFVVDKVLSGNAGEIKAYTVATEVFGRGPDFNQSIDPIVSIQASRLRQALERYYLIAGMHDPIRINIPKGSYVPTFLEQAVAEPGASLSCEVEDVIVEDSWPSILIQPFKNLTGDPENDYMGIGFATELAVEVARLQDIKVLFPFEGQMKETSKRQTRFVLDGGIFRDSTGVKIIAHLIDTKTAKQIWGDTHKTFFDASKFLAFQEEVVQVIVSKISGDFGTIRRYLSSESTNKTPSELSTYEAILRFYEYEHSLTPESFIRAMGALTQATNLEPACGQAWSMLARLYANIYSLDIPGFDEPLEKAIEYAEKGACINPGNQRILANLALIRFFSNESSAAIVAVDRALALNPNSLFIIDGLAYLLMLSGEWDRGKVLARKAIRLNPYYRHVLHYALWVDCLRQKNYERAYQETMGLRWPTIFWYPLAKASTLGLLGKYEEGQKYIENLLELRPDFPSKGRVLIGHYIKFEEIVELVVQGLQKAGLKIY